MTHNGSPDHRQAGQLTGKHVLMILLGFFGTIIAVDMYFVTQAVSSYPGEQVEKSYYQGLDYNETLSERARQAAAGYRLVLLSVPDASGDSVLDVRLVDAKGNNISRADVTGAIARPATAAGARVLAFTPLGEGVYRARFNGIAVGAWQLSLTAAKAGTSPEGAAATLVSAQTRIVVK